MAASTYLLPVPHGTLSSDHDLASSFCFQLLGSQAAGTQDPPDEVVLGERGEQEIRQ